MKSIITTYPDFHALPKGIKRMLLASESFFFVEAYSNVNEVQPRPGSRVQLQSNREVSRRGATPWSIFGASWKN